MKKLIQLAARVTLGKELAMAITLMQLISDAVKKKDVQNISLFVYKQLPTAMKSPQGPTTEAEFVDLVQTGEVFLRKVKAAFTR